MNKTVKRKFISIEKAKEVIDLMKSKKMNCREAVSIDIKSVHSLSSGKIENISRRKHIVVDYIELKENTPNHKIVIVSDRPINNDHVVTVDSKGNNRVFGKMSNIKVEDSKIHNLSKISVTSGNSVTCRVGYIDMSPESLVYNVNKVIDHCYKLLMMKDIKGLKISTTFGRSINVTLESETVK